MRYKLTTTLRNNTDGAWRIVEHTSLQSPMLDRSSLAMTLWLLLRRRTARMSEPIAAVLRSPASSAALQELRQVRDFRLGCHYGGKHCHLQKAASVGQGISAGHGQVANSCCSFVLKSSRATRNRLQHRRQAFVISPGMTHLAGLDLGQAMTPKTRRVRARSSSSSRDSSPSSLLEVVVVASPS